VRRAFKEVLNATIGIGVVVFMLSSLQGRLLYFPTEQLLTSPADIGLDYQSVRIATEDGLSLHAWWIPVPAPRATVLFLHGNAGNISYRLGTYRVLAELGLSILAIDYRGFGLSEGSPTEAGTYLDAKASWQWMQREQNVTSDKFLLMGRSLGGGVASGFAEQVEPAALILESTFTSIPDMAAKVFPLPGIRRLSTIDYNNLERVAKIKAPKLIIHSSEDDLIPFSQGQRLFEAAAQPKTFSEITGNHADGFLTSGQHYVDGLASFLDEVFPREGS
jgi:fermentation-respiration switch protein FrsA (DUF1100 family)